MQAFIQLHDKESEQPGTKLIVQRRAQPLVYEDSRELIQKLEQDLTNLNILNHFNPNCHVVITKPAGVALPLAPTMCLSLPENLSAKEKVEGKSLLLMLLQDYITQCQGWFYL